MEKRPNPLIFTAGVILLLAGCSGPSVNLATTEPIKVDINVRLDVYQHEAPGAKKDQGAPEPVTVDPLAARRNRAAEIQNFKNSRLIGEGRDGLLVVLSQPSGDYGDYLVKTVTAENRDRMQIMKELAESQKRPLPEVQAAQAEVWRARSFGGEYIEIPQEDGSFQWTQKSG